MSMIRHPAVYTAVPLRNQLVLGKHFSYRLRDSSDPRGMAGLPPLTKTVTGSESGSAYTDPRLYQFPNDNGNTNSVAFIAEEDETDLYLDQVLSLYAMEAGEQIIVACDVAFVEQRTTSGAFWSWGKATEASQIAFEMTAAELPTFLWRARGAGGSSVSQDLTYVSGDTLTAFKSQGRFSVVTSIIPTSSTLVDIEMRFGNGTLEGLYTYSGLDMSQGGAGANPGISGGISMAAFVGLSVGCQNGGSAAQHFWGRGTTEPNVGRFDVIHGWRGTYDAGLTAAVLEEMHTTNALDYPPSLAAAP